MSAKVRARMRQFDDPQNVDDLLHLPEGATDPASLPPPAEIAAIIAEELETALARFRTVVARLA
jgi:hypothetical protein